MHAYYHANVEARGTVKDRGDGIYILMLDPSDINGRAHTTQPFLVHPKEYWWIRQELESSDTGQVWAEDVLCFDVLIEAEFNDDPHDPECHAFTANGFEVDFMQQAEQAAWEEAWKNR